MHPMDEETRRCVDECLGCHRACVTTASQHCLDVGGRHVEPRHFRLMPACADLCRTSAYLMELGTELHKRACAVCAEVCEELRGGGRHGRVRPGLPRLRRELPPRGGLSLVGRARGRWDRR
jgi:hypothetical protein